MPTNLPTNDSLITLCKKNPMLRYVTIKEGWNDSEIYLFKYKQNTTKEGFINNFWYAFITPDETVIVLGHETTRRTINYAHCVTYCTQETAAKSTPPGLFLFGTERSPAKAYLLDKMFENTKK